MKPRLQSTHSTPPAKNDTAGGPVLLPPNTTTMNWRKYAPYSLIDSVFPDNAAPLPERRKPLPLRLFTGTYYFLNPINIWQIFLSVY